MKGRERERNSPSCLAWRHSIDVRLSRSTTITVTRKLLCNRLHLLQLSSLNWCSSLHLLLLLELSRAINVLASHEGARDSFDFILRSHDKMWNDLFQKRLFVEDLLWLAIWKKTQWKEWIVRFIYRLQDKIDLGLLLLLLLLRWCTANKMFLVFPPLTHVTDVRLKVKCQLSLNMLQSPSNRKTETTSSSFTNFHVDRKLFWFPKTIPVKCASRRNDST